VLEGVEDAAHQLHRLAELGIDLDDIAERLQIDGVPHLRLRTIAPLPRWTKNGRQSRQPPALLDPGLRQPRND
jgi:hypothetical protein